jgi:transcriptional regulator with XRE-family HTH domain
MRGGWTLEQVAAFSSVNVSTLLRIELKRSKPNRLTERSIDAALTIMETTMEGESKR